ADTTYTLYLFGVNTVEANQNSAFTPVNNGGVTFEDTSTRQGMVAVNFSTSASYSGDTVDFTWGRIGSNNFAAFNGFAVVQPPGVPTIATQPSGHVGYVGDNIMLTPGAVGDPTPSLQWQHSPDGVSGWSDVEGAIS